MAIFRRKEQVLVTELDVASNEGVASAAPVQTGDPVALETYKLAYKGGHPDLPKAKIGEVRLLITPESFVFNPTLGSKKFWNAMTLPYSEVSGVEIVARQVSTGEAMLGGMNSRQLNQDNNMHFSYVNGSGNPMMLRFEMISGVTVMGQAKKCREFEDRLRSLGITNKFKRAESAVVSTPAPDDIPAQIAKLAGLRDQGILSEDEFTTKKRELLSRL